MSLSGTRVGREKRCAEGERPEDCLQRKDPSFQGLGASSAYRVEGVPTAGERRSMSVAEERVESGASKGNQFCGML